MEKTTQLASLYHQVGKHRTNIEQGTSCVMTVDIRRGGESNMTLAYSLYRRGEKTRPLAGIERWEAVESVLDIVPDQVLGNFLTLNIKLIAHNYNLSLLFAPLTRVGRFLLSHLRTLHAGAKSQRRS